MRVPTRYECQKMARFVNSSFTVLKNTDPESNLYGCVKLSTSSVFYLEHMYKDDADPTTTPTCQLRQDRIVDPELRRRAWERFWAGTDAALASNTRASAAARSSAVYVDEMCQSSRRR